jgi:hypothetical protein
MIEIFSIARHAMAWLSLLFLLLLQVHGTVVLPEYNKSYVSLPALFGGDLRYNNPPVMAHLTLIKDWPLLCPRQGVNNDDEGAYSNENFNQGDKTDPETQINNINDDDDDTNSDNNDVNTDQSQLVLDTPDDGLPVALLVERGQCTFYEKAMMTSKYFDNVQYLVIYDNEVSPDLVPMSSDRPTNITLVFVSNMSGEGESYVVMTILVENNIVHVCAL